MNPDETRGDEPARAVIRELLRQIPRTLLAYKLYAPTNQLRQEVFRELVRRFEAVFELVERFTVKIEPNRLSFGGEPLLDLPEAESHFVFRLYKDGARHLSFARGLDEAEIERFVEIVRGRPGREADTYNVVDALWEADLPHVSHAAVDGFAELLAEDGSSPAELAGASAAAKQFDQVVAALVGKEGPSAEGEEEPTEDLPATHVIRVHERVASPLRTIMAEPLAATQELANWIERLRVESDNDLLTQVEDLLFYVLEDPSEPLSKEDLVHLFGQLLAARLIRGSFGAATELVIRLQRMRFELPQWGDLSAAILDKFAVAALRDLLQLDEKDSTAQWDPDAAVEFFEPRLGLSDDDLAELLGLALGRAGERLVGAMLYRRLLSSAAYWRPRLEAIPVRVLLAALAAPSGRPPNDPNLVALYWDLFRHPETAVRVAAIDSYPGRLDDRFRDLLIGHLEAEDVAIRLAVLRRLGAWGDSSAGAFLVNRLRREELEALPPEEVAALTSVILGLGPERYVAFLRSLLEKAGAFRGALGVLEGRGAQRAEPQVRAILEALAESRHPSAVELLRDVRQKAKGGLREICDELWRGLVVQWGAPDQQAEPEQPPSGPPTERERELPPEYDGPAGESESEAPDKAARPPTHLEQMLKSFLDEVE